jgi:hypothetical protein
MLKRLISTLDWLCARLEDFVRDFAVNYARELLSAHGLIDLEVEHIRSKMGVSQGDKSGQQPS